MQAGQLPLQLQLPHSFLVPRRDPPKLWGHLESSAGQAGFHTLGQCVLHVLQGLCQGLVLACLCGLHLLLKPNTMLSSMCNVGTVCSLGLLLLSVRGCQLLGVPPACPARACCAAPGSHSDELKPGYSGRLGLASWAVWLMGTVPAWSGQ